MRLPPVEQILDSLRSELQDTCEREHDQCNEECPVYDLNGSMAVGTNKPFSENRGCDCFKNGHAMLKFIMNRC